MAVAPSLLVQIEPSDDVEAEVGPFGAEMEPFDVDVEVEPFDVDVEVEPFAVNAMVDPSDEVVAE